MTQVYAGIKWIIAGLLAFWVALPTAVTTLLCVMALDYLSGLGAAYMKRDLHSRESINGLIRKTLVLLLLAAAHAATKALNIGFDLGSAVAMAYIVNELISITENCAEAGVPVPQALMDALVKAKSLAPAWKGPERRKRLGIVFAGENRRGNGKAD